MEIVGVSSEGGQLYVTLNILRSDAAYAANGSCSMQLARYTPSRRMVVSFIVFLQRTLRYVAEANRVHYTRTICRFYIAKDCAPASRVDDSSCPHAQISDMHSRARALQISLSPHIERCAAQSR